MNSELISREADEIRKAAKIKTHFARIVVDGPVMNPCYSILWYDPSDRDYHIGYSSYSLMNVYDWLRDEFEITSGPFDNEPVAHGKWLPHMEVMEVFIDHYLNTTEREVQTGWQCSVCGRYEPKDRNEMPYCHCGAKMDLEE